MNETPFSHPSEEIGYKIFSDELEADSKIFFHGTAETNLKSIIKDGFIPKKNSDSISYARKSSLALKYACEARNDDSLMGVIICVKFKNDQLKRVTSEHFGIHVYDINLQPTIVTYCLIPNDYVFM